ncbi:MATE family efflux transporter, partial [Rhizobiaceae sp. 2RAB30]
GFAYFGRDELSVEALWWSFPVGSIVSLLLGIAYYRFGGWRTMHRIENRPAAGEPPDTGLGVPRQRAVLDPES